MPAAQVLVVDDEPEIRQLLKDVLEDEGYRVESCGNAAEARAALAARRPDLMLLDVWLPDADGVTVLRDLHAEGGPGFPVVMISGHGTIETAVEATRLGAYDFIEKPIGRAKLLLTLERALEAHSLRRENESLRKHVPAPGDPVGASRAMQALRQALVRAAATDAPVLIAGEAGTGKETLARYLHQQSARAAQPFLSVHAGGLQNRAEEQLFGFERDGHVHYGLLDQAQGGTLYLDGIEQIGAACQRALAACLEERRYTRVGGVTPVALAARLVAACADPKASVDQGTLEGALYYQIGVLPLEVPPLRTRNEDVPVLLAHFAEQVAQRDALPYRRFSLAAQNRLRQHDWPGNLRELGNLVQRMLILGGSGDVELDEVERALGPAQENSQQGGFAFELGMPLREARDAFERAYLTRLLKETGGSVTRLAQRSGMERTHLYRKLKDLGIDPKGGKVPGGNTA